jgi:hypothetical protein
MEDSVSAEERRTCWIEMSPLFVDNAVDYKAVAEALHRHCPNMSEHELKRTFYGEVAPVLGTDGLTPAPAVWLEFDSDEIVRDISGWLARQKASFYYGVTGVCWRAMCRWIFRSIWLELERELRVQRRVV